MILLKIHFILASLVTCRLVQSLNIRLSKSVTNSPTSEIISINLTRTISSAKDDLLVRLLKKKKLNANFPKLRSLGQFEDFSFLKDDQDDEPRQFCGETLFNLVEYYCVYIKGTSVYESANDVDASEYDFVSRNIKEKRENRHDENKDHAQGN